MIIIVVHTALIENELKIEFQSRKNRYISLKYARCKHNERLAAYVSNEITDRRTGRRQRRSVRVRHAR